MGIYLLSPIQNQNSLPNLDENENDEPSGNSFKGFVI